MNSRRSIFLVFLCFSCYLSVTFFKNWMDVYYWEEDSTGWAIGSPILKPNYTPSSAIIDPTRVTRLSWSPRAFLYSGFLSKKECDELVFLAQTYGLGRIPILGHFLGTMYRSENHTNFVIPFFRNRDIVEKIDNMIAAWTLIPKENGEPMILQRYEKGEGYVPLYHYDDDSIQSNLIATVIIYLSNFHHGGEIIFPNLKLKHRGDEDSWSECARQGSTLEADKGDALLIFNLHPNCTLNENSLYGNCPVTDGRKWVATRTLHTRSFSSLKS